MYEIVSRETIGLREPKSRSAINPSYVKGLTVHYTGDPYETQLDYIDDVFRKLKNIQKFHMDDRGWADIGYSFAVSNYNTEIFELRGFDVYSAHSGVTQINKTFASVVWLGGQKDIPNDNAKKAIERLQQIMSDKYNKKIMVTGHRDHKNTLCPSASMYEWLTSVEPSWKKKKVKKKRWSKKNYRFL